MAEHSSAPQGVASVAQRVAAVEAALDKRGMTANFDLWDWIDGVVADPSIRANAEVVMLAPDGRERARFLLDRCVPVKLKAPPLNAKDGMVAIEELQLAYESLSVKKPTA